MITKGLVEKIYSAASMQRWNDHPRPFELTELDKQAHKMIIAYVIAKREEENGTIDWSALIEGGIFEFFHRITLMDLKPAVFHQLMREKERQLNRWVFDELKDDMERFSEDFYGRFREYFVNKSAGRKERQILEAAHYFATKWEFKFIGVISDSIYGIRETERAINAKVEDHKGIRGFQEIQKGGRIYDFIDLSGQLRFQQRWSQTLRIPKTSVLGHMLVVAFLSYLFSLDMNVKSARRRRNDFYAGLFHDFPEVLTKDIVSPVKRSVPGLDKVIKEYENRQFNKIVLPLLPEIWHDELKYYVQDEFENRITAGGKKKLLKGDIGGEYDRDAYNAIDGRLIEVCDKLAAFVEASLSIKYGIKTRDLIEAMTNIRESFSDKKMNGVSFYQLFDYFDGR